MKKIISLFTALLLVLSLSGCVNKKVSDSLDTYLEMDVPLINDNLSIFPEKSALETVQVERYHSLSASTLLFDDAYLLLECSYTPEQYEQEIHRLKNLGAFYREDLFYQPAYVMLFCNDYYEYALVDNERLCVVYIYAMTPRLGADNSVSMLTDFPTEYYPIAQPEEDIDVYEYAEE